MCAVNYFPFIPSQYVCINIFVSLSVQSILSHILSNSDDAEDETTSVYEDKFMMIKVILNEYNKEKRIPITDDPLLWWKVNGNTKFRCLKPIARLTCRVHQVWASEQLFSGAGMSIF